MWIFTMVLLLASLAAGRMHWSTQHAQKQARARVLAQLRRFGQ